MEGLIPVCGQEGLEGAFQDARLFTAKGLDLPHILWTYTVELALDRDDLSGPLRSFLGEIVQRRKII